MQSICEYVIYSVHCFGFLSHREGHLVIYTKVITMDGFVGLLMMRIFHLIASLMEVENDGQKLVVRY